VAVQANRYPVPLSWAGSQIEVHIRPEEVVLTRGEEPPVRYTRLEGKHQVARWSGPPRQLPRPERCLDAGGPPMLDLSYLGAAADVLVRPLESYAALIEEVGR
jgi:hypothetical protein